MKRRVLLIVFIVMSLVAVACASRAEQTAVEESANFYAGSASEVAPMADMAVMSEREAVDSLASQPSVGGEVVPVLPPSRTPATLVR